MQEKVSKHAPTPSPLPHPYGQLSTHQLHNNNSRSASPTSISPVSSLGRYSTPKRSARARRFSWSSSACRGKPQSE